MRELRQSWLALLALAWPVAFYFLARTERTDTLTLFSFWIFLFAGYLLLARNLRDLTQARFVFAVGIAARLAFLGSVPLLSDDVHRFLWDGRLLWHGLSPFANRPVGIDLGLSALANDSFLQSLYPQLNSAYYYSVYPPLMQGLFFLAAAAGDLMTGIHALRLALLLAEAALFFLPGRFFRGARPYFWLHPLWIAEGWGNLHLEVYATVFFALAIFAYQRRQFSYAGMGLAAAIQAKLWPVLWMGLLRGRTACDRRVGLGNLSTLVVASAVSILLFAVSFNWQWPYGFIESVQLYSADFVFNPGPLYLLEKAIGSFWYAFEIRPLLGRFGVALTLLYAALHIGPLPARPQPRAAGSRIEGLFFAAGNIYLVYLLLSFVIHPWYLLPLLFLQPQRLLILVWSFLAFFSYSAYLESPARVPDWFLFGQYLLLLLALIAERWQLCFSLPPLTNNRFLTACPRKEKSP